MKKIILYLKYILKSKWPKLSPLIIINIKNQLKSYIYTDLEKEQVYRLYCST